MMVRILLALWALLLPQVRVPGPGAPVPATAVGTWSLVQFKMFDSAGAGTGGSACAVNTTTCTVTISAPCTGGGVCLLVSTTIAGGGTSLTTTTPTGGQTWTHCAGTNGCLFGTTTDGYIDAWYVLAGTTTGQTSVTCHPSAGGMVNNYNNCGVYEYKWTGSSITFDSSGGGTDTSCSTCAGVALTLGGTSDVIIQSAMSQTATTGITAISGSYTSPAAVGSTYSYTGNAGSINTASGAAPNWTNSAAVLVKMAAAFKGN